MGDGRSKAGWRAAVGSRAALCALVAGAGACNTFDEDAGGGIRSGPDGGGFIGEAGSPGNLPLDLRPTFRSTRALPPLSGGTLLALSDGKRALVADPDRDRLLVVNIEGFFIERSVTLEAGAQPSRSVEVAGRAHVLLRGTGEVLALDLSTGNVASRVRACDAPRGIAVDARKGALLVACSEGRLVELAAAGGNVLRDVRVDLDVRDVVHLGTRVVVSRFRRGDLLELDDNLGVSTRRSLPSVGERFQFGRSALFEPAVAWRTISAGNGSVVVVHQRAMAEPIDLDAPLPTDANGRPTAPGTPAGAPGGSSAYGNSGDGCGGIVHSAVTVIDAQGNTRTSPQLAGSVLPVDVAVSPGLAEGQFLAVASAGLHDAFNAFSPSNSLAVYRLASASQSGLGGAPVDCLHPELGFTSELGGPVVAVAFEPVRGRLLALTREPSLLAVVDVQARAVVPIALGGEPVIDTGHELFHRDAGGGIACASCHPDGTEDARTWNFSKLGPRRTQALDVGLAGTAPFHWDGTLPTVGALMHEVFTVRMGGAQQGDERVAALEDYVFALPRRPSLRSSADEAVQRGNQLFHSKDVGCSDCHSGEKFTNNLTVDVGKGIATQVPSLLGVALRAPFMHDGCAATLRERFEPTCGGAKHGNTAELGEAELGDLVAYLESL